MRWQKGAHTDAICMCCIPTILLLLLCTWLIFSINVCIVYNMYTEDNANSSPKNNTPVGLCNFFFRFVLFASFPPPRTRTHYLYTYRRCTVLHIISYYIPTIRRLVYTFGDNLKLRVYVYNMYTGPVLQGTTIPSPRRRRRRWVGLTRTPLYTYTRQNEAEYLIKRVR